LFFCLPFIVFLLPLVSSLVIFCSLNLFALISSVIVLLTIFAYQSSDLAHQLFDPLLLSIHSPLLYSPVLNSNFYFSFSYVSLSLLILNYYLYFLYLSLSINYF